MYEDIVCFAFITSIKKPAHREPVDIPLILLWIIPVSYTHLFRTQENIVGLKEATGNLAQASKTMYLTDGKLDLYSGEDGLVVPLMSIGGIGVISVWANLAPAKVHNRCESFFKMCIRDRLFDDMKADGRFQSVPLELEVDGYLSLIHI